MTLAGTFSMQMLQWGPVPEDQERGLHGVR